MHNAYISDAAAATAYLELPAESPAGLAAAALHGQRHEAALVAEAAAYEAMQRHAVCILGQAAVVELPVPVPARADPPAAPPVMPTQLLETGSDLWKDGLLGVFGAAVRSLGEESRLGLAVRRAVQFERLICKAACLVGSAIFWERGDSAAMPNTGTGQRRQAAAGAVLRVLDRGLTAAEMLQLLRSTAKQLDGSGARIVRLMYPGHGGFQLDLGTAAAFVDAYANEAAAAAVRELLDAYVEWVRASVLEPIKAGGSGGGGLCERDPMFLFNVPGHVMRVEGDAPVTRQAAHPDNPPGCAEDEVSGRGGGLTDVVLAALHDDRCLLPLCGQRRNRDRTYQRLLFSNWDHGVRTPIQ